MADANNVEISGVLTTDPKWRGTKDKSIGYFQIKVEDGEEYDYFLVECHAKTESINKLMEECGKGTLIMITDAKLNHWYSRWKKSNKTWIQPNDIKIIKAIDAEVVENSEDITEHYNG